MATEAGINDDFVLALIVNLVGLRYVLVGFRLLLFVIIIIL